MTLCIFFKMAAISHIELSQGYCRPTTHELQMSVSSPSSNFDSIGFIVAILCYEVIRGDIAILCWAFGLKLLPIYIVVSAAHAQNEGLIYFRGRNWRHTSILICGDRFTYSSSNFQRRSWSFKGCLLTKSPMLKPVLSQNFLTRRK